ncbi:hypothetical protein [Nostoc sp. CHAB 5836]|uniref:hypothetical protein n=1 Tax=Nostoc sp. CHAB 5836 TaxID=2780404 RepID=UPI001E651807|nr:hypothetical protein [Nostoc sp. CHAB 5836]
MASPIAWRIISLLVGVLCLLLTALITQVAGYQNPGASDPEISAIANDKLVVALRATTILTNHYKQCNEAVSGINNCLL